MPKIELTINKQTQGTFWGKIVSDVYPRRSLTVDTGYWNHAGAL